MWPGQQPPGGEQNPQQQNPYQQPGYQQPNPYRQPGYQQQADPAGQPGQWSAPTVPAGVPQAPTADGGSGGGGGNRTKVIAIVAAAAVVVAAGVTGFLLLDDKDDEGGKSPHAEGKPSASAPAKPGSGAADGDDERGTAGDPKPTVPGWQVVVNPRWGTAFDVPPDWDVRKPDAIVAFEDVKTGKPLMTMSGPAYFKSKWCTSDDDRDGRTEDKELGAVGTKGANGAKNTDEVAVNQVAWWVFGGYTQPDKKSLHFDEKAKPYTTKAGIKGSIAWSRSQHTPQQGKCASEGKAITFGFKNAEGDFVAWSLYGAKDVKEEIPDETIMKILSTVRLHGDATES
ncbi:hypothetical protein C9F11_06835 [Streptomyces sp. YIM 121038]|uniref:hypothetical protein n=1 Tax=Streptomyces sp. YIM 121038 TaxID=2136401 RepID=UPI00111051E1|nr:hypothetical protein [Streptomyces sp. YIM 121038]QCX75067.1 hypothetical protein C9F11_06835 [Streptomyces sp. YIM 121038]